MSALDNRTYRVEIAFDTKTVNVSCFGINSVDSDAEGAYASVEELPKWMQLRLATLSMLDVPPPPNDVDGVGCRVGPYLFWVVK